MLISCLKKALNFRHEINIAAGNNRRCIPFTHHAPHLPPALHEMAEDKLTEMPVF